MLTVDYDKLGLRPGDLLLDLGCGFGRHAFEGLRRGARVVACDMATTELIETRSLFGAMATAGEIAPDSTGECVNGDATRLPFADDTFDRIIASEVMEHIPDDLAALDELTRVLKPGRHDRRDHPGLAAREGVLGPAATSTTPPRPSGGHVRIYTENELRTKMRGAGLTDGAAHHAHALHSPYWWLKCAVGTTNDDFPLVRWYHRLLVWDIERAPAVTRVSEQLLNPVLGKSLVVYATKPIARTSAGPRDTARTDRRPSPPTRRETVDATA